MTDQTPDLHTMFQDNLDTYLAGGLSAEETAQFEAHASTCPDCAAKLAAARKSDEAMCSLFVPLAPNQDFEDRLIAGLRRPLVIRRLHPMVRLAASGVAAAVVLGAVGYYGGRVVNKASHDQVALGRTVPTIRSANRRVSDVAKSDEAIDSFGLSASEQAGVPGGIVTRGVTNSPSNADWVDQDTRDQGKMSGANSDRNHRSDFSFFYQAAGEDSAVTKTPAQILGRRIEPNGVSNLVWKADRDNVIVAHKLADGKKSEAETTVAAGEARKVPYDDILKYPANWPKIPKEDLTMGLLGGRTLQHGDSDKDTQKLSEGREAVELETTKLDRKSGGDQTKEPARASAQPVAEVPQLVRTASTPPVAVALVPSTEVPASLGSTPLTVSDATGTPPTTQGSIATSAAAAQKIIRTGSMEFEVDSFDSAFVQITKIAAEEGGFVAATDSDKLENGKVKGTVTLRCPPEHLDTLVLKLRGLGDLKTQRITAQDVTKEFTDYESQLRAARAMEERLLDIIKTGKGAVKDLVEAEKQLGIYREKIEHIEGELRYMGSQVALSTLSVSLMERDIRTPFAAVEAEQISAGIEAEDVERARAEALKLIDDAKGRVIESELKKLDAGQLAATLVAEVSPDAAGALGDHLKQLGHVARWEATRKQTTEGGSGAPTPLQANLKLQRQPTRFSVSIYNLANVAPRQITSLTLVANDVEAAYRSILAAMNGDPKTPAIGRVVTSNLSAQKSDQVTGSITLEVKSDQAPAIEAALRTAGSVMHLTVTENADQNGVTDAKRGYGIIIIAAANVPAREQQTITVASKDVGATYNKLLAMLRDPKASARVINSQLTEPEEDNITGSVDFEIPIANRLAVDALLADGKQSDVISRNVIRSADTENTLADKLHLTVSIGSAERLPPHETTRLTLEATDVAKALDTAVGLGGSDAHVTERSLSQQPDGRSTAHVAIDVPLSAAQATLDQLRSLGKVASAESARDAKVTAGPLARARFEIELENAQTLVPPQDGMSASVQRGLRTALNGLLWSVQMVVVGLVLVGPFALVIWAAWRLVRRGKNKAAMASGGA